MNLVGRLSARLALPFAVCFLVALVGMAHAGDKAQLTGSWSFNPAQSDDARQKVQQAQRQDTVQPGAGGGRYPQGNFPGSGGPTGNPYPGTGAGYPGTGVPPGGGYPGTGGYPGAGGPGPDPSRNARSEVSPQEWARLAANPKYLNISQRDGQILITDSEHTRVLYPDGKKHQERDEDGQKISIKTEWRGDELIAETRLRSGRLTEKFSVSPDGKQLNVVSRFEDSSLSVPLSVQRVYDLGSTSH